jgi:TolB protein
MKQLNQSIFVRVRYMYLALFLLVSGCLSLSPLHAQKEVRVQVTKGVSVIPLAMPMFETGEATVENEANKNKIYRTLWDDLEYSRVFRLVPEEYYNYIQKFDPKNISFKDWESIRTNILIVGRVEMSGPDRVIFSIKVYDVLSERFIFGRNFGGKTEFIRVIAHRAADEMMKYFGEKPIYNTKIVFMSTRDGNQEIYMMDYDGHRQRRITFNTDIDVIPSWSADNEKVLYTSYRNHSPDLYMFHLYTGKTQLISTGGANYSADWSPENGRILFTSTKAGNAEIFVRNIKTGKEKRITFNPAIDTTARWSPSGKEVVFTSQRSGTPQIYIMDDEGTNVRRITHDGTYHDSPAWSPDGTRILYVSRIEGRFDIYVYNLKDNTIAKLTEQQGRNENPTWSPDGRHIIFASNRNGSYQLYTIDYDGTNLRRLTSRGENKMPQWQKR